MPKNLSKVTINESNIKLTESIYPNFKQVLPMLSNKLFKGVCVPDAPVSSKMLRSTVSLKTSDKSTKFLVAKLIDYKNYLLDLLNNVKDRFDTDTMSICTSIGKFLNFDSLYSVDIDELSLLMNPRNLMVFQDDDSDVKIDKKQFLDIVNSLPFTKNIDKTHLVVQYNELLKFVFKYLINSAKIGDKELTSTITLLKKFVKDMGDDCVELVNLLLFV